MSKYVKTREQRNGWMRLQKNELKIKILQSRGSSLNERSHKCFKSGDAHLYLLQVVLEYK